MGALIGASDRRIATTAPTDAVHDRPHRVWWLGYWPTGSGVRWWLTHRILRPGGPGPVAEPTHGAVEGDQLADALRRLRSALPGGGSAEPEADETDVEHVRRAWRRDLASSDAEFDLSQRLGRLLLPPQLADQLSGATPDHGSAAPSETVVIASGPSLAHVPFELLVIDGTRDLRLLESARVRAGLSAAAGVGALPATASSRSGTLRVIDPGPSTRAAARRGSLYAGSAPSPIYPDDWIDERWLDRHGDPDQLLHPGELLQPVTRETLEHALQARPERLLFLGHALSGTPDAPALAGLVLADPLSGGPFEPFTAAQWIQEPHRWPAPPRVALMSCHSNDTHLFEQMGLVQAAIHAGAQLVTSTRWVLPADRTAGPGTSTTEMALAVDAAHDQPDTIGALRLWQLSRLAAWRQDPGPDTAPLIWAAPVSYQQAPLGGPRRESS